MKKDITESFIFIDDFCKEYDFFLLKNMLPRKKNLTRTPGLKISEIMTIMLLFHQSPAKNFKFFYQSYLQLYRGEFPGLVSYNRFVELQQRCLGHFYALLMTLCAMSEQTGISYVDSTCLPVCHNKRTSRHLESYNKIITDNRPILTGFSDIPTQRRFWKIGEFAEVPCGCTHVKSTREVGFVALKRSHPGKSIERIEIRLVDEIVVPT